MREHSNTERQNLDPEQTTVEQTSPTVQTTARASTPLHLQQTIVLVCTLKIH